MENSFDSLSSIAPGRDAWRLKVRIVRMWPVFGFLRPDVVNSLEMVLVDEKGGRIHATVRKQLIYIFKQKLTEGEVYKMSYFSVIPSGGAYRTTPHPYKLFFQMKTKVQISESALIPRFGLSLSNISDICSQDVDFDYLVVVFYVISMFYVLENFKDYICADNKFRIVFHGQTEVLAAESSVIRENGLSLISSKEILGHKHAYSYLVDVVGVLTSIQYEHLDCYVDGVSTVARFELTDHRGCFDCVLRGSFVEEFQELFRKSCLGLPIVVMQFAKIDIEKGSVVVRAVTDITKIMLNPPYSEVVQFRMELGLLGLIGPLISKKPSHDQLISEHGRFNGFYPHKTLKELYDTKEENMFVVAASIVSLVEAENWWYPLCSCGRVLKVWNSSYCCEDCLLTTFKPFPKRILELYVEDDSTTGMFRMFDDLLKGIGSLNHPVLGTGYAISDNGMKVLKGKDILLIVKKNPWAIETGDEVFEIVAMTDDFDLIKRYHYRGKNYTPTKCLFEALFGDITPTSFGRRFDEIPSNAFGKNGLVASSRVDGEGSSSHIKK